MQKELLDKIIEEIEIAKEINVPYDVEGYSYRMGLEKAIDIIKWEIFKIEKLEE